MNDRSPTTRPKRLLHPVKEAREALGGMGQTKFYSLVAEGKIKIVKVGRRSFLTDDELHASAARITSSAD